MRQQRIRPVDESQKYFVAFVANVRSDRQVFMALRVGILLAAGQSRRMGQFKQLLPWQVGQAESPMVAVAFDAIASVCDAMIVVVGHRADHVVEALQPRTFSRVDSDGRQPMLASVHAGLRKARDFELEAVWLHPADHPHVAPHTLHEMLAYAAKHQGRAVIPEFRGTGGHPVLIPEQHIESLLAWTGDGGLRAFWREHPELMVRLEVEDPSTVRDYDRPEDLQTRIPE